MQERNKKERQDRIRTVNGNKAKRFVETMKKSLKAQKKFRRENDLKRKIGKINNGVK